MERFHLTALLLSVWTAIQERRAHFDRDCLARVGFCCHSNFGLISAKQSVRRCTNSLSTINDDFYYHTSVDYFDLLDVIVLEEHVSSPFVKLSSGRLLTGVSVGGDHT